MSTSVWLRTPRTARARAGQTLSHDQVARAAVELADADGLEAVTMRSVAERLGVAAMSLYWYVDTKHQITELMVDLVFRDQPAPSGPHWRAVLRSLAQGNRDRSARHPWLDSARHGRDEVPAPAQLDHYERTIGALCAVAPWLGAAQLSTAIAVVDHFAAGHSSVAWPGALATNSDDVDVRAYLLAVATDGAHPSLARFAGQFAEFSQDRFEDELRIVLDGLEHYLVGPGAAEH